VNTNEAIFRDAPIARTIAHMAIPSMIASLVTIVYNLADTFFVGQTHDPYQVVAVSFANSPFIMYMATACLIGIGGNAVISILLGEKNQDGGRRVSAFCCYASLIVSAAFGACILIFMDPLIRLLGCTDAQSHAFTRDYLHYIALGSPFILFFVTAGHVIRGEGAAQASMTGNIVGTVVNIVLDPLFILVLKMGTAGAPLSQPLSAISPQAPIMCGM